jgi:hypothetical protein
LVCLSKLGTGQPFAHHRIQLLPTNPPPPPPVLPFTSTSENRSATVKELPTDFRSKIYHRLVNGKDLESESGKMDVTASSNYSEVCLNNHQALSVDYYVHLVGNVRCFFRYFTTLNQWNLNTMSVYLITSYLLLGSL